MISSSVAPARNAARPTWWRRRSTRVGGSVLLLGVLFLLLPATEVLRAIKALRWWEWVVAIGGYLALHLAGVVKWRLLVNAAGAEFPLGRAVRAYYWGLFGNTFLPSIVGGDAVRLAAALRDVRSPHALVLGSVLDRVLDVAGLLVIAGIGAWLSPFALPGESRGLLAWLMAGLTLLTIGGALTLRALPLRKVPFRFRRRLVPVRRAARATRARSAAVPAAFAIGLFLQTALIGLNWQLGRTIGIAIPLYVWLFVWPLGKLSGLLPVTQGGIGVREATLAALFAPFGVSATKAVATGLVFEVVIIAGGLISGALAFLAGARREPVGAADKDTISQEGSRIDSPALKGAGA